MMTLFKAVSGISGYEKARVERYIADQKLVLIACICYSATLEQSWQWCPIIPLRDKHGIFLISERGLLSRCFVHEKNLTKL